MSDIILSTSNALAVPQPKEQLTFRLGNQGDIGFIDEIQKQYPNQLGFMPKSWLEGKIKQQQILVAEEVDSSSLVVGSADKILPTTINKLPTKLGYIIAQDRYLKRDELGIVYQLAVKPGRQRGFIGAALLKAQFDRSEYGCRLYCCWCAQDIEANKFWESMGFYPLAFRNGSETKGKNGKPRVQIFWEKKIRGKDDTINWWFPAKTEGGAMGADRLALPIPPSVHWSEVEPIEIPVIGASSDVKLLEDNQTKSKRSKSEPKTAAVGVARSSQSLMSKPPTMSEMKEPAKAKEKPKRLKKPKAKIDPVFITQSKELRARYLEQVNEHGYRLESAGKYELTRDNKSAHPYTLSQERGSGKLLEAA